MMYIEMRWPPYWIPGWRKDLGEVKGMGVVIFLVSAPPVNE